MLSFQSKNINNFYLKAVKQTVDCLHYVVNKQDEVVLNVYSLSEMSIVELPGRTFRIDRERRLFRKRDHQMYDHTTNEHVGTFEFPDWQRPSKANCIIRFEDSSIYSFQQHNSHRRLFKPQTWRQFFYKMHDYNEDFITYCGSQTTGLIRTSPLSKLVPIACGIFAIDESLRVFNESD